MNRRGFLRTVGLSSTSLVVPQSLSVAAQDSKDRILGKADARIDTHRKGGMVLRLFESVTDGLQERM